jgi:enamine deaminase RidA (YjgF/YER057c/UK114 family)
MKALGGNQVVFYGIKGLKPEEQLADCLQQLEEYMDEKQIYPGSFIRHNIYVNESNETNYRRLKPLFEKLSKRRFPLPLIVNVLAQAPTEGDVALESTHIQGTAWNCLFKESKNGACQLIKNKKNEVVIGSVQIDKYPDMHTTATKAFSSMEKLLDKCGMNLNNVVAQWNYLERMLDEDQLLQRYQAFNNVRANFYTDYFSEGGYPASVEVGMDTGGLIIQFLAVKERVIHSSLIDNPLQKAAHQYSADVLSTGGLDNGETASAPLLERARTLKLGSQTMLFVSGTSAIIGERVTAEGDVAEQTMVVFNNIKQLSSAENRKQQGIASPKGASYSFARVFVHNTDDMNTVYETIHPIFGDTPVLLVQAALPRKDILIEVSVEMDI